MNRVASSFEAVSLLISFVMKLCFIIKLMLDFTVVLVGETCQRLRSRAKHTKGRKKQYGVLIQ